jgi:tetratricopeptide (TPR) repeat protein
VKPKKHSATGKRSPQGQEQPVKSATLRAGAAPISGWRHWLPRLLAAVLIPLLLLGGLELALRLCGYGHPTSFFLTTQIANRAFYVTNDKFGFRFFPPALARTPLPLRMPAQKPGHTCRIFLFGESAAQGDPDPAFGIGRYLEVLLRDRYPGTDFEVVCAAMTAINSHAVLPIARECAGHEGDLWIVYMGNNEMVGPFGAGTVFGRRAPSRALVRSALAIKTTRIGQLITTLAGRLNGGSSAPKTWSGMNMFKEQRLQYHDASRLQAYENFSGNLEDILRAGRAAGVPVLVSTVACNLEDCAPFASLHSPQLNEAQKSEWDKFYQAGVALESAGAYQAALEPYSKAAAIDSEFAELPFRIGRCQLALSNSTPALRNFELARDYDALAFRADTRINQIIKAAANRHAGKGIQFIDAAEVLAQASPKGIPGQELFYEHVHLTFAGNYLLARAFAGEVAKSLPASIAARQKGAWASEDFCDDRLAVSPWDRYRLWQMNFSRVSEPPFTDQLNDVPRARLYMAKLEELKSRMNPAARDHARELYEAALAAIPEDDFLSGNFAQFLTETGDLPRAVAEQQRACELLPCFPAPLHKAGLLLVRQGKTAEATACFSRALALRDDYVPALNELGLIRAHGEKTAEAADCFSRALRLNPGYVETYFNLGFLEQSQGHLDRAMARYQEAAQLQPNGPATYFNQAVILAVQHHRADAIRLFQTAVWMSPAFWQARYLLGVELAGSEKVDEAQAQFAEVVRCRPDFARAHLNLGVAFAKQGKLEDALREFHATLELSPTNKSALQYVATTEALKARRP